jgi:hypothetical protein
MYEIVKNNATLIIQISCRLERAASIAMMNSSF